MNTAYNMIIITTTNSNIQKKIQIFKDGNTPHKQHKDLFIEHYGLGSKNNKSMTFVTIVDGHNRYSVCTKHNIPFKVQEKEFADKNAVILWMIDNQLGRRNLPDYARVELNLRKEELISPGQGARTDLRPNGQKLNTREQLAKVSKVGEGTVERVKFIRDNADQSAAESSLLLACSDGLPLSAAGTFSLSCGVDPPVELACLFLASASSIGMTS